VQLLQLQHPSVGWSGVAVPATLTVQGLWVSSETVTAALAFGTELSQVNASQFRSRVAVEQSGATWIPTWPALSGFWQLLGFGQLPGAVQERQYQPFTWNPIW
jgi:hypothetical protein